MRKIMSAAIVTIRDADKMTPKGRRNVAAWLRRHAAMLTKDGRRYSSRFTGRYLYLALALVCFPAGAAAQDPAPSPSAIQAANRANFEVQSQVGAMTVTTSDTGTSLTPMVSIDAEGPLVFGHDAIGRVGVRLGLTSTPGSSSDPTAPGGLANYKGVEVGIRVGRVIGILDDVKTSVVAEYGFTTLIKGSDQVRPKSGLVHSAGVGFTLEARNSNAQLTVEVGFDEATVFCKAPINCLGTHSGVAFLLYGHLPIFDGKVLFGGDVSITPNSTVPGVVRTNVERVFVVVDPVKLLKK